MPPLSKGLSINDVTLDGVKGVPGPVHYVRSMIKKTDGGGDPQAPNHIVFQIMCSKY